MRCLEDCPPSLVVTALTFLVIASVGFIFARWRRWTLLIWLPVSFLVAAPLLNNGWQIDDRGWLAMGAGWIVALLGGLRPRTQARVNEAA